MVSHDYASKRVLLADKILDLANLIAVGLAIAQAFNAKYRIELALAGIFLAVFAYVLAYKKILE